MLVTWCSTARSVTTRCSQIALLESPCAISSSTLPLAGRTLGELGLLRQIRLERAQLPGGGARTVGPAWACIEPYRHNEDQRKRRHEEDRGDDRPHQHEAEGSHRSREADLARASPPVHGRQRRGREQIDSRAPV